VVTKIGKREDMGVKKVGKREDGGKKVSKREDGTPPVYTLDMYLLKKTNI